MSRWGQKEKVTAMIKHTENECEIAPCEAQRQGRSTHNRKELPERRTETCPTLQRRRHAIHHPSTTVCYFSRLLAVKVNVRHASGWEDIVGILASIVA